MAKVDIEVLRTRIRDLERRNKNQERTISSLIKRYDRLLDWVKQLILAADAALHREGWEPGLSAEEVLEFFDEARFNLGIDEGTERPADIAEVMRIRKLPLRPVLPADEKE